MRTAEVELIDLSTKEGRSLDKLYDIIVSVKTEEQAEVAFNCIDQFKRLYSRPSVSASLCLFLRKRLMDRGIIKQSEELLEIS
jgi:hypothetical protein